MSDPHIITAPADVLTYVRSGNATFTLKSLKTGKHYTYRAKAPWDGKFKYDAPWRFIKLRTGSDEWQYIGMTRTDDPRMIAGRKGNSAHAAFRALDWVLGIANQRANNGQAEMPADLEVWHDGRCGRCGRQLTHPSSIEAGIGPECATKV